MNEQTKEELADIRDLALEQVARSLGDYVVALDEEHITELMADLVETVFTTAEANGVPRLRVLQYMQRHRGCYPHGSKIARIVIAAEELVGSLR